jgi:hypothetical protein
MGLFKAIIRSLTNDPYWVGQNAHTIHFLWERTYEARTECGFKIRYTVRCRVHKINYEQFKDARMLEEKSQQQLIDAWHNDVFLPKFRELQCSFRIIINKGYIEAFLCRIAKDGNEEFIFFDPHCIETAKEMGKVQYRKWGCEVRVSSVLVETDDAFIKENYDMIKLRGLNSYENSAGYRAAEEHMATSRRICSSATVRMAVGSTAVTISATRWRCYEGTILPGRLLSSRKSIQRASSMGNQTIA